MRKILVKFIILFIAFNLFSGFLGKSDVIVKEPLYVDIPQEKVDNVWVDSVLSEMSLDDKIAQLFMIAVYSNKSEASNKQLLEFIEEQQIGGVIFMQGGPMRQALLNNRLQAVSKVPLMIGMDAEWGLNMRLDSVGGFPRAMAMGALGSDQLVLDFGEEMARQCKRMGVHISFAPVLDVNSNALNPVINSRSYGTDKFNVARKGLAYAMGLQNNNVLAVGKHFPGHGDTHTDSHHALPVITHSKAQLKDIDLFPFETLIDNGIGGVMVAHLDVPSVEKQKNRPSTLSKAVIDSLLKRELSFKGLVFTDALNMKGVTNAFPPGKIEVEALKAGNDVLLFSADVAKGINAVKEAVLSGELNENDIHEKCKKVLKTKKWLGLDNYLPVDTTNLYADLNTSEARNLNDRIIEQSLTLASDKNNHVPIVEMKNKRVLALSLEKGSVEFFTQLNHYMQVDTLTLSTSQLNKGYQQILDTLKHYDVLIYSQHKISQSPYRNYGMGKHAVEFVDAIPDKSKLIFVAFGNPYALRNFKNLNDATILVAYDNSLVSNRLTAQAIFGGRKLLGKLPVTVSPNLSVNQGKIIDEKIRLSYGKPYSQIISDTTFHKVDALVQAAIKMGATPGCQVYYARNGEVLYNKAFGHHTYENKTPVLWSDMYDVASITKMAASTLAVMKLYEQNKINPTVKVSKYLRFLKKTDKKNVKLSEILAHHSGLKSWIPFYKNTVDSLGALRPELYGDVLSSDQSIQVSEHVFLRNDYVDSIFQAINDTALAKKKKYRYSDLGFYWIPALVNKVSGEEIDSYLNNNFYPALGMNKTGYLPLKTHAKSSIVPTERDTYFRNEVVHGFVHDPGAAMLGGISGHAGLFSSANDLGKLGQMLLDEGKYGGRIYLKEKTISAFNKPYFKRKKNRRGLGLDKPALSSKDPSPTCEGASSSSFGHSGFTGTYIWVDPEFNSVYVFLSNRTFPSQDNKKLAEENIRTDIQQIFYDVLQH